MDCSHLLNSCNTLNHSLQGSAGDETTGRQIKQLCSWLEKGMRDAMDKGYLDSVLFEILEPGSLVCFACDC